MEESKFKSGFVSIVGKPNVGKSTLMNRLVGERLSIISPKAQTTRHRIMGILTGEDYQIVYSDTPGILEPSYSLHQAMMTYVKVSLEDADVILLVLDGNEKFDPVLFKRFQFTQTPLIVLLNKMEKVKKEEEQKIIAHWKEHLPNMASILSISALKGKNVDQVFPLIVQYLPVHPPYFPKDDFTNRSERFFAGEIIREKIFLNYQDEIPYSTEVSITAFKEGDDLIKIQAEIYIERNSQKGILIGKGGSSLKKVGTESRLDMEKFFGKKVFLETHVKVASNWRKESHQLRQFGYFE